MPAAGVSQDAVSSLYRITQYPVDLSDPVFTHYPSFKLGVQDSVGHYAQRLTSLAERLITSAAPGETDWVLSAPPYKVIPAAANLLCWRLFDLLRERLPSPHSFSVIDIRERKRPDAGADPDRLNKFYDYSKVGAHDRARIREKESARIIPERDFRDRRVIFINDIKVSGAQQRIMQRYFSEVGAATVHWLYIIDVEASIGASQPQLENDINYSSLATFEDFFHLLAGEDVRYTSKCIWRLFAYSVRELERLFKSLEANRKQEILALALEEDFFHAECFAEKIDLLKAHCAYETGHRIHR